MMAKRANQKVWMQTLGKGDAAELSQLLTARKAEWSVWEYKLHRDNILIYVPIPPLNLDNRKPESSVCCMEKLWRVAPVPGGPFRLEYLRHTGQWWPVFDAVGELKKIAGHIAEQAKCLGYLV